METHKIRTSESAVYREVAGELVVIQLDTGHFYYFNRSAKPFLDYFQRERTLTSFFEAAGLEESPEEVEHLNQFCHFLLETRIVKPALGEDQGLSDNPAIAYERPRFLRQGEKKLDEIASEVAVLTTGFY